MPEASSRRSSAVPGRVAVLIAEVLGHLDLKRTVHDPRRQLGQHPIGSEELEALPVDLGHQPLQRRVIDHRRSFTSLISLSAVVMEGVLS